MGVPADPIYDGVAEAIFERLHDEFIISTAYNRGAIRDLGPAKPAPQSVGLDAGWALCGCSLS